MEILGSTELFKTIMKGYCKTAAQESLSLKRSLNVATQEAREWLPRNARPPYHLQDSVGKDE